MNTSAHQRLSRFARIEPLERRVLMDGDVDVAFRGGDLTIKGDGDDNQIVISQPGAGTVRVAGLDETAVNGEEFVDFAVSSLDDVRVNMRQGGEDEVSIQGALLINGGVAARMGDGVFVVEGSRGQVEIRKDLDIRAGAAAEVAIRNDVVIRGDATLRSGGDVSASSKAGGVPDFDSATFSNPLDIDNPYFPLVIGITYTYQETSVDDETGETVTETIIVEVTNQTKTILGVVNRVLRDRVFVDGLLVEDTEDWHAQDDDGNVWYFGEQSTDFEYDDEGNLISTSTETSWQAGVDGARPGVIMLADPQVGIDYYQEFSPSVALDQGEVLATNESVNIPGFATFDDVLRTKDTSVLSPASLEHKFYAPGLGLIQEHSIDIQTGEVDGVLRLISAKLNGSDVTEVVDPDNFNGTNVASGAGAGPVRVGGEMAVRAGGEVVLERIRAGDEIEISSKSLVTVLDADLDDLSIKAGESVGLRDVTASEEVEIRGDLDVYVFDSVFSDRAKIKLGPGDNELVIEDSAIDRLKADGGKGENIFDDAGGNTFGDLDLKRFEEEDGEE